MLVLTRKPSESVTLTGPDGTQITVMVTSVSSGRGSARLGFTAPPGWHIVRTEALDRPASTEGQH
jgi:sRNA-binding carbon storage regulator CsrA